MSCAIAAIGLCGPDCPSAMAEFAPEFPIYNLPVASRVEALKIDAAAISGNPALLPSGQAAVSGGRGGIEWVTLQAGSFMMGSGRRHERRSITSRSSPFRWPRPK